MSKKIRLSRKVLDAIHEGRLCDNCGRIYGIDESLAEWPQDEHDKVVWHICVSCMSENY
jgi:hypothetical protein